MEYGPALIETHSSLLFFVGDSVFKLKKAIDLGFLDWTSRAARELACHREVELNRRLAPDVYRGVADISGPAGELLDHLVVMRRMPDQRRLSTMASRGRDLRQGVGDVARALAAFHATSETSALIAEAGTPETVLAHWRENSALIRRLGAGSLNDESIDEVDLLARRYLAGRHPLLQHRVNSGQVRDVHGDLQADDIFLLDDGPRILDCLDFDDRLRHGDVLSDTGFLAMDLERLGRPDLAAAFLEAYRGFSGESHPASLAHHYIAYRAQVRAKVSLIRRSQGDPAAAGTARQLHDLCLRHLRLGRVRLVLVGGVPGSGKSTLARALAEQTGWTLLRSDEVRRGLDLDPGRRYTDEARDAVYVDLLSRAERLLGMGESVILDATWASDRWRRQAQERAARSSSDLHQLHCEVPLALALERVTTRAALGVDASEAGRDTAALVARDFDAWPAAQTVDTSGPDKPAVAEILIRLEKRTEVLPNTGPKAPSEGRAADHAVPI